mgnify:CR=1 FL=1
MSIKGIRMICHDILGKYIAQLQRKHYNNRKDYIITKTKISHTFLEHTFFANIEQNQLTKWKSVNDCIHIDVTIYTNTERLA